MLYCLICSPLLIVKVIFVITVFFLFLLCVSTILVNKDDYHATAMKELRGMPARLVPLCSNN